MVAELGAGLCASASEVSAGVGLGDALISPGSDSCWFWQVGLSSEAAVRPGTNQTQRGFLLGQANTV